MDRKSVIIRQFDALRKKAEDILNLQPETTRSQSARDITGLIHELQVHQIELEYRIKDVDGRWHWLQNRNIVFARTEEGHMQQILGTAQDVTAYKLAQEKLDHSLEQLSRSNKELEQFAYIASHDLKTPLLSISGFTHLLEKEYKDKFDKNTQEYFDFVKEEIKRMENLIDDLLTYARIGDGSSRMEFVDAEKIIIRVIMNLTVDIERNGARITHDSLPVVHYNTLHLEQMQVKVQRFHYFFI
jgi:signal transduction histidine kinase